MIKRLKIKVNYIFKPYLFAIKNYKKGFSKLGISLIDLIKFYNFSTRYKGINTYATTIFGKEILSFNNYFWFYHSIKELFLEEVYKCVFKNPAPYIIDCGANIGLSIIYFKRSNPNCKILAFEPDPYEYKNLINNINVFGLTDVKAENKGVWKENGLLEFYSDGGLGGTIIHKDFSKISNLPAIPFIRLRDYLNCKIDFLKIDIEGAEYEVLKDIKDKLCNVEYLFLEYHGYGNKTQDLHDILNWIKDAGFRYHIKSAWENLKYPFIEKKNSGWDLQLNIYCYR